ncbi:MAG: baseplate J/gp47 family protein [Bradymonadaceae bacterium]
MADEFKGLTTEGYNALRTADFIDVIREDYEARTGKSIDWDDDEFLKNITAIMADRLGDISEGSQAAYDARDPNNATGQALDALMSYSDVTRRAPTEGTALQKFLGDVDTAINSTRTVVGGGPDDSLEWKVTRTLRIGHEVEITGLTAQETYSVTVDGNTVSYEAKSDDTIEDVLRSLRELVNNDSTISEIVDAYVWAVASTNVNRLTVEGKGQPYTFSVSASGTGSMSSTSGVAYANVQAREAGALKASANQIDEIGKGTEGWNSTTNPAAANTGNDRETDAEARRRFFQSLQFTGNGAPKAVLAHLLALEFLDSAIVLENDERTTQTIEGVQLEGNSMLCIVYPTTLTQSQKQKVAETIWESKSIGTKTLGTDVVANIEAEDGFDYHEVAFDFADQQDIDVRTTITLESGFSMTEVQGPVEAQIVAYFDKDIGVGDDVRRLPILARIATVDGVQSVDKLELRESGGTYAEQDVTILPTEFANLATNTVQQ